MAIPRRGGKRIIILCEGETEELAVRHFIHRQWCSDALDRVGLQPIDLRSRLQDVASKGKLFLNDPEILAVFTLIDLHGMDRAKHKESDSLEVKVANIRSWLTDSLKHVRSSDFYPHICVHQTEAWILSEGLALSRRLGNIGIEPDPNAERRDLLRPPTSILNDLFLRAKGDRYHKIKDGRPLFASMQFSLVYKSCGYFRTFYDDLRNVAHASLP